MRYTIHSIPATLDERLRKRAADEGSTLSQLVMRLLNEAIGLARDSRRRDLRDVAGTWKRDPAVERALFGQDSIDPSLWK
jgi:hypothetical protein